MLGSRRSILSVYPAPAAPRWVRLVGRLALVMLVVSFGFGPGKSDTPTSPATPQAVPAARQGDDVVIITIRGPIDRWTAMSVERRIADAEASGADAIVMEIDSPGGEVDAVLRISNALKASSIANTVGWVNHDAYSGGAIVALACREIVASDPAALGDAFAVTPTYHEDLGRPGMRGLTPEERTKILPVLLSDVTDSARRGGYDEFIVQAMVVDGIELWLVEHKSTKRRYAINRAEFRVLFSGDTTKFIDGNPIQGKPLLAGVTGGRYEATEQGPTPTGAVEIAEPTPDEPSPRSRSGLVEPADPDQVGFADDAPTPPEREFRPASDAVEDVAAAFADDARRMDLEIGSATQRPFFTEADRGDYELLGYLTDGQNAVILRSDDMLRTGFASRIVQNDNELKAFFGATTLTRIDPSWSERLAGFMTHPAVRGVLIVVFLLGLFIEMVSPGLVVPSVVSMGALVALLGPPLVFGMAGWWEMAAIVVGFGLMAVEVFVLPGFGVFGLIGLVALFIGLVGTFIPDAGTLGSTQPRADLTRGVVTVMLSGITAATGMYLISRYFGSIPMLNRLVLTMRSGDPVDDESSDPMLAAMNEPESNQPGVGDEGVAITPLRPSGRADFGGRVVDVVTELGYIDPDEPVCVVSADQFRVVVERVQRLHGRESA